MGKKIQVKEKEDFFLDVFNHILNYNEKTIMVIFDVDGNIWFKFVDLLRMLGYTDIKHIRNDIKINNLFIKTIDEINKVVRWTTPPHFQPKTKFISESGLYQLLTKSNKALAQQFLEKYLVNIMPTIRKTGNYISNKNDKTKINKLNVKLENYKTELNYYDDKYKFIPSIHGYFYINENNQIKNGVNIKCYKVGFDTDMKDRISQYKVGNFKYKLLCYIPLQIDRKAIEQCVKSRLKGHLKIY